MELPKAGGELVELVLPKVGVELALPKAGVVFAVKAVLGLALPNVGAAVPNAVDVPKVEFVPPNDGAAVAFEGLLFAPNENVFGISLVDVFVNKLVEVV